MEEKFGRAIAIVGLQFGSEGKGAISAYLAPGTSTSVRIGAANAGHTVIYEGRPYVMRQIPCGWVNPLTKLVIGISAFISLPILLEEIKLIEEVMPIRQRLCIDAHAHVITDKQIAREVESGLSQRIASTSATSGLGIAMATVDKILRSSDCLLAKDVPQLKPYITDTVDLLNRCLDDGQIVVFEGTQGSELSLDHGYFPYTTSRDTSVMSLFAGTGVNPYGFAIEVIGVIRAYPIRVGGNSGPFDPDSKELSWQQVARRSGTKNDIGERTSVTKTIRRVATFSWDGYRRACRINRPTEIALTFADHIDASVYESERITTKVENFIERLESICEIPVGLIKTGPNAIIDCNWYRRRMLRKVA